MILAVLAREVAAHRGNRVGARPWEEVEHGFLLDRIDLACHKPPVDETREGSPVHVLPHSTEPSRSARDRAAVSAQPAADASITFSLEEHCFFHPAHRRIVAHAAQRENKCFRLLARSRTMTGMSLVQVEQLTKSFGGDTLFAPFSAQIGSGDRIALIGDNGVGKSTLLRLRPATKTRRPARSASLARRAWGTFRKPQAFRTAGCCSKRWRRRSPPCRRRSANCASSRFSLAGDVFRGGPAPLRRAPASLPVRRRVRDRGGGPRRPPRRRLLRCRLHEAGRVPVRR